MVCITPRPKARRRALVADLVPQAQRGGAYGLYNAAIGITVLPASLIAGLLWQGVGDMDRIRPQRAVLLRRADGIAGWSLVCETCKIR